MKKKHIILGIESSCDETAASVIQENDQGIPIILSNIVSSQVNVHKAVSYTHLTLPTKA